MAKPNAVLYFNDSLRATWQHLKMPIYGIGLPRTGTKTLAQSLRVLGLCGTSKCILTDHESGDSTKATEFSVNNSSYQDLPALFRRHPDSLYILTTRQDQDWVESASSFQKYNELELPFPGEYENEVRAYVPKNQLLVLNILDEPPEVLWRKLCTFLQVPIPDTHFPLPNCDCPSCNKVSNCDKS